MCGPSASVEFCCLDSGQTLVFHGGNKECFDSFVARCLQHHGVVSVCLDLAISHGCKQLLFQMDALKIAFWTMKMKT